MRAELLVPEQLVISETVDTIEALDGVMPVFLTPQHMLPNDERPDIWLAQVDPPLLWGPAEDEEMAINYLLITPEAEDPLLKPIYEQTVQLSMVTDESLLQDSKLDAAKVMDAGRVVVSDNVEYYRMAARDGDAEAQYQFARLFEEGRGVGQATPIAKKWYRRAAENGHRGAKERLQALGEG